MCAARRGRADLRPQLPSVVLAQNHVLERDPPGSGSGVLSKTFAKYSRAAITSSTDSSGLSFSTGRPAMPSIQLECSDAIGVAAILRL